MIFRMQVNISGDRAPPETCPADNRAVYYHGRAISGRYSTISNKSVRRADVQSGL
ncbi:hypothetical protein CSB69_0784 [Morganella morganii]|nr:hypothetical protein CSB69_0784 [Morganella morganii]EMP51250.1 hypothetical protein C790_01367 [Morganella morganii SC01]